MRARYDGECVAATCVAAASVAGALQAEGETVTAVLDLEPAAEHPAEMREVRDARRGSRNAQEKLERGEAEHEYSRREGERREKQHHPPVREVDAEGEEEPVDAAGGADHRRGRAAHHCRDDQV